MEQPPMEIGVIPHKYKYVKLSKEEKAKLMEENKCFVCKKIGCRAKISCTKNAKKSNEPLLGFGTKTVSCTLAEREKTYKNKKQKDEKRVNKIELRSR